MEKPHLDDIPEGPGVYIFRDASGNYLYVGKAKSLRSRVVSYFREGSSANPRIPMMMSRANSVDYILTANEIEALLLENNLIKQFKPKYNISLRDDKQYPFIKLTVNEEIPRILMARRISEDNALYYGPYTSSASVREIIRVVMKAFRLCTCRSSVAVRSKKPCLNYQMKLCSAPCAELIRREDYLSSVSDAVMFLEGKNEELLKILRKKMEEAAERYEYERAASFRDSINAINVIAQRQKINMISGKDQDIVAFRATDSGAVFCVLIGRSGKLICQKEFFVDNLFYNDPSEVLESFIKQYYQGNNFIPFEIITETEVNDRRNIEKWLSQIKGRRVNIISPTKGRKYSLVRMASENAELLLKSYLKKEEKLTDTLKALKNRLSLASEPKRIEAVDISNTMGTNNVGAIIVWEKGLFKKNQYRKFLIKKKQGIDDFAMIKEVVARRINRLLKEKKTLPDLFLIDGGIGQVNKAMDALKEAGAERMVDVVGLAKGRKYERNWDLLVNDDYSREEIILPGRPNPVRMKKDSSALILLQSVRDEVHRFAISYHKKLRNNSFKSSVLDSIKGIGERKKSQMLKIFGSVSGISKYTPEEISEKTGINLSLAKMVIEKIKADK
ncbi:MAG: excinuclease ABC subunit UvrC [Candidatus Schekmanbacteria bacterium]|nr:excinuclease ABC subunit UvrC [Candidatus Schekmanbacteria bacterium]